MADEEYLKWDDLRAPATTISIFGFGDDPSRDSGDGCLLFSAAADERIFVIMQMPHDWKEGSNIIPHIHWSPTNTNTGTTEWELEWQIANIDGTFSGSWSDDTLNDDGDGVTDKHQCASFSEIDMSGHTLSCIIKFRLWRRGSTGGDDDYNANAKLLEFDIHYQKDSLGSREETTK